MRISDYEKFGDITNENIEYYEYVITFSATCNFEDNKIFI